MAISISIFLDAECIEKGLEIAGGMPVNYSMTGEMPLSTESPVDVKTYKRYSRGHIGLDVFIYKQKGKTHNDLPTISIRFPWQDLKFNSQNVYETVRKAVNKIPAFDNSFNITSEPDGCIIVEKETGNEILRLEYITGMQEHRTYAERDITNMSLNSSSQQNRVCFYASPYVKKIFPIFEDILRMFIEANSEEMRWSDCGSD